MLKTTNGYYCGTRVNNSWWRRFRPRGFFHEGQRGDLGRFPWAALRLYLTRPVRVIEASSMKKINIGDCGFRWLGAPVIWIEWTDGERNLRSGFAVAKSRIETERWVAFLKELSGN